MESRIIEYPRPGGAGLDYHSSPLIGEIPTSDYSYYRSIDQLRTTINERDVLQTIATSNPLHNGGVANATTDLRAIEFSHKSFMSTASERTPNAANNNENNGEMHHQHLHQLHPQNHHHHHQHHENQSNKHQHHNNNNHNLMDDRANNNVHNYTTAGEIKTKSYRKNRKHNRNASANNSFNNNISSSPSSSSVSSLLQQQNNNNYHQPHQQIQPYQQTLLQQQHQSTTSNDQLSPHSHNADHPEDEMIAGPVTGQTKEMKVGVVLLLCRKENSSIQLTRTHVRRVNVEKWKKFINA